MSNTKQLSINNKDLLLAGAAAAGVIYCIHKRKKRISGIGAIIFDLPARFDSRASFYGKAQVHETPTYLTLYSYNTEVAKYNKRTRTLKVYGRYSNTTARHIKEFARLCEIYLDKVQEGTYKA